MKFIFKSTKYIKISYIFIDFLSLGKINIMVLRHEVQIQTRAIMKLPITIKIIKNVGPSLEILMNRNQLWLSLNCYYFNMSTYIGEQSK